MHVINTQDKTPSLRIIQIFSSGNRVKHQIRLKNGFISADNTAEAIH